MFISISKGGQVQVSGIKIGVWDLILEDSLMVIKDSPLNILYFCQCKLYFFLSLITTFFTRIMFPNDGRDVFRGKDHVPCRLSVTPVSRKVTQTRTKKGTDRSIGRHPVSVSRLGLGLSGKKRKELFQLSMSLTLTVSSTFR